MPSLLPIQLGKVLYHVAAEKEGKDLEHAITVFLGFIQQQRMTKKLSYIIDAFDAYAKEVEGRQSITITTAEPLSKNVISMIANVMNTKSVEVIEQVEPAIIAGMLVQQGNTVLDASIATQLETLKRTLS